MRKCLQCRKHTKELDSRWERIRGWFFNLFHEDILDLSQNKFVQGFGDGYKEGFARANELLEKKMQFEREHSTPIIQKEKLEEIKAEDILTIQKTSGGKLDKILLGGVEIQPQFLKDLKHEAVLFKKTRLWNIFQETLKQQAYLSMFEKSQSFDDMKSGKAMLHIIQVQKNIIDILNDFKIKEDQL